MSTPSTTAGSRGHGVSHDAGAIGAATTGLGAALTTLVAGACCVSPVLSPLIVGVLGASGAAWAAGLKPYTWWILGASGVALAGGFWTVYRPRPVCDMSDARPRRRALPIVAKLSLWFGAACWTAALFVRLVLPQ